MNSISLITLERERAALDGSITDFPSEWFSIPEDPLLPSLGLEGFDNGPQDLPPPSLTYTEPCDADGASFDWPGPFDDTGFSSSFECPDQYDMSQFPSGIPSHAQGLGLMEYLNLSDPIQPMEKALPSVARTPKASNAVQSLLNRKRKRTQTRFSLESIEILQEWLSRNSSNPYPSAEAKDDLARRSGLSIKQIQTWFTNFRRRQPTQLDRWLISDEETVSEDDIRQAASSLEYSGQRHLETTKIHSLSTHSCPNTMIPLKSHDIGPYQQQRNYYCLEFPPCSLIFDTREQLAEHIKSHLNLATPHDDEESTFSHTPVLTSILSNPIPRTCETATVSDSETASQYSRSPFAPHHADELSPIMYGSLRSVKSPSSFGSAFSQCSDAVISGPPKRGRRRKVIRTDSFTQSRHSQYLEAKPKESVFYCTFCGYKLSAKTWKRHEETQHLPRHQWTCMAHGFRVPGTAGCDYQCVFCGTEEPDDTHGDSCHRIAECLDPQNGDRTFLRKDHLAQHLKNFHSFTMSEELAMQWHHQIDYSNHHWQCGFCRKSMDSWNERARHIAKHFREGLTMEAWDSDCEPEPRIGLNQPEEAAETQETVPQSQSSNDRSTNTSLTATLHCPAPKFSARVPKITPVPVMEHFSCRMLRIGSWQRRGRSSTDLIVFSSPNDRGMYYYMMEHAVGYRIEIPFSTVETISLHMANRTATQQSGFEGIRMSLTCPPKFSVALPEVGTFTPCEDFTGRKQASRVLQHYLFGNPQVLLSQLAKLMSMESFMDRHSHPRNDATDAG